MTVPLRAVLYLRDREARRRFKLPPSKQMRGKRVRAKLRPEDDDHMLPSRVTGIGPQIGCLFPVAGMQGYVNLKGYGEFHASRRTEGWSAWLTLALSPRAEMPAAKAPLVYK